jgi:hypothetical protein
VGVFTKDANDGTTEHTTGTLADVETDDAEKTDTAILAPISPVGPCASVATVDLIPGDASEHDIPRNDAHSDSVPSA